MSWSVRTEYGGCWCFLNEWYVYLDKIKVHYCKSWYVSTVSDIIMYKIVVFQNLHCLQGFPSNITVLLKNRIIC